MPTQAPPAGGHPLIGYLALALPPGFVLADTAAALARGWTVESRFDRLVLATLAAVLVAVTGVALVPRTRRWLAASWAKLLALSVALCLSWLVAEALLGPLLAAISEPLHARQPNLQIIYNPVPEVMPGVSGESRFTTNSWGVRGPEPPGRSQAHRILCIGGSSTACTYLDDTESWPAILMEQLDQQNPRSKQWVANAGLPGYRSSEHLEFVEHSELMDRIDCLIVQAGINDFMRVLRGEPPAPPLWHHSRVWRLVQKLRLGYSQGSIVVEDAAGRVYARRRALRSAAPITDARPDLHPDLDAYANRARAIVRGCRQRGVRPIFTSQPTLWRRDLTPALQRLLWFGEMSDGRYLSVAELRAGMDQYNAAVRSVCAEMNVDFVDLAEMDGREEFFYDDCHYTEAGARKLASILAHWLPEHPGETPSAKGAASP